MTHHIDPDSPERRAVTALVKHVSESGKFADLDFVKGWLPNTDVDRCGQVLARLQMVLHPPLRGVPTGAQARAEEYAEAAVAADRIAAARDRVFEDVRWVNEDRFSTVPDRERLEYAHRRSAEIVAECDAITARLSEVTR